MSRSVLYKPGISSADRLSMTMVLAVAVHTLVILGIGFGTSLEDSASPTPPPFEITLVNTRSQAAPEKPEYLAQASQEGSGNTQERVRPETMMPSMAQKELPAVTSPNPPADRSPHFRDTRLELMTQAESDRQVRNELFPTEQNAEESVSAETLISRTREIASLQMELGDKIKAYSEQPRKKFITASTQEYKYASYMDSWRRKVERVGTLNFPAEAKRRGINGKVLMDVVLNPDGTIRDIEVRRSSGYAFLDQAAQHIVRLASPFAPFPDNIREEADELHIVRTFDFTLGGESLVTR